MSSIYKSRQCCLEYGKASECLEDYKKVLTLPLGQPLPLSKFLCSQNPSNGMSDQVMHVFGAKVDFEGRIKDSDEVADKVWMPIAEVKELLRNNQNYSKKTLQMLEHRC